MYVTAATKGSSPIAPLPWTVRVRVGEAAELLRRQGNASQVLVLVLADARKSCWRCMSPTSLALGPVDTPFDDAGTKGPAGQAVDGAGATRLAMLTHAPHGAPSRSCLFLPLPRLDENGVCCSKGLNDVSGIASTKEWRSVRTYPTARASVAVVAACALESPSAAGSTRAAVSVKVLY